MRHTLLIVFSLFFSSLVQANNQEQIDYILKQETPPFGVVFEVVEGDRAALEWAIPQIKKFSEQLRKKFPEIGVAVVSHGSEQFALMKTGQKEFKKVHDTVQSLVKGDVPVHICGTHASWYGKKAKDFPDYIDVAPAGPAQIRDYEDMGYELIVMDKP